ncbi:MAG TPA: MerR family transcriptional regulator [Gaiellaceae bacterium]|nr:MerR family transcriptional regulator [Gaiellaceae bacterium]
MTTTVRSVQSRPAKLETIGAVCRRLRDEFPDISISKIRYLEDRGLLSPRRTPGGYRLFSEEDIERLQAILRLQRDEFLPLRVIRQELATRLSPTRSRRASPALEERTAEVGFQELCERAHITGELARDLEEYGVLAPSVRGGERYYTDIDVETALVCGRLAASGMSARHLRTFRTTADRAAGLLEQVVAPALRSRSPERHQQALEELRALGEAAQELTQLLLWRELRRIAAG